MRDTLERLRPRMPQMSKRKAALLGAASLTSLFLGRNVTTDHPPPERVYAQAFGEPAVLKAFPSIAETNMRLEPSTTTTTTEPTTTTVTLQSSTTTETQPLQTPDTEQTDTPQNINGQQMRDMGSFYATCYQLQGRTASGTYVHDGTIAVDPNVIPLGSNLYIDGWGNGTAEDTGSAIKGHHIDIWKSSCANWGNQDFEVYIIGG